MKKAFLLSNLLNLVVVIITLHHMIEYNHTVSIRFPFHFEQIIGFLLAALPTINILYSLFLLVYSFYKKNLTILTDNKFIVIAPWVYLLISGIIIQLMYT